MVITTTSIGFILLSIGLGICGWRFRSAFRGGKNKQIGFLVSSYYFLYSLQTGILGFGSLLLAGLDQGLFFVFLVAGIFLAMTTVYGTYALSRIFLLRHHFFYVSTAAFFAVLQLILTLKYLPQPFIDSYGGINWNTPSSLSFIVFICLAISISVFLVIFLRVYSFVQSRTTKLLASVLAGTSALGIITNFFNFVLPVNSFFYAISTAFMGLMIITYLFLLYLRDV